jgi:hypothetical protein
LLSASNTASVKEFNVALLIVAIQQPYQSFDVLLLLFFLVVASASVVVFAASAFPPARLEMEKQSRFKISLHLSW